MFYFVTRYCCSSTVPSLRMKLPCRDIPTYRKKQDIQGSELSPGGSWMHPGARGQPCRGGNELSSAGGLSSPRPVCPSLSIASGGPRGTPHSRETLLLYPKTTPYMSIVTLTIGIIPVYLFIRWLSLCLCTARRWNQPPLRNGLGRLVCQLLGSTSVNTYWSGPSKNWHFLPMKANAAPSHPSSLHPSYWILTVPWHKHAFFFFHTSHFLA